MSRNRTIAHLVIVLEYLRVVMSFECYVGENSDYKASRCLSCQGEGVACLCMMGTPLQQLTNTGGDIYGSRAPLVDTYDGLSIHRLPPGSDQLLEAGVLHNTGIRGRGSLHDQVSQQSRILSDHGQEAVRLFNSGLSDRPRPGVFKQGFASQRPQPSIAPVLRECWPNPYNVETPGCSIQKYKGAWYNICRCDTEYCNTSGTMRSNTLVVFIFTSLVLFSQNE